MSTTEFISGWIGGALGILSTHPIDTVRVRIQFACQYKPNVTYYTVITEIKNTIGFRGLYRGVLPPVTFRGLAMGLNRTGYNTSEKYFKSRSKKTNLNDV
eukprot:39902_1